MPHSGIILCARGDERFLQRATFVHSRSSTRTQLENSSMLERSLYRYLQYKDFVPRRPLRGIVVAKYRHLQYHVQYVESKYVYTHRWSLKN